MSLITFEKERKSQFNLRRQIANKIQIRRNNQHLTIDEQSELLAELLIVNNLNIFNDNLKEYEEEITGYFKKIFNDYKIDFDKFRGIEVLINKIKQKETSIFVMNLICDLINLPACQLPLVVKNIDLKKFDRSFLIEELDRQIQESDSPCSDFILSYKIDKKTGDFTFHKNVIEDEEEI